MFVFPSDKQLYYSSDTPQQQKEDPTPQTQRRVSPLLSLHSARKMFRNDSDGDLARAKRDAERVGLAADALFEVEREGRWAISIDERHSRFVVERDYSRWLFNDPSTSSSAAPPPPPLPEIITVFNGDILDPTVVKKMAPLAELEAKLRALEGGDVRSLTPPLPVRAADTCRGGVGDGAAASSRATASRRGSMASQQRFALVPQPMPSPLAPAGPTGSPQKGYRLRILERREGVLRGELSSEEAEDFRRLRSQCGRGMLSIIGAITELPAEMRALAMLRLHEDERRAYMLRPTLMEEHG